MNNNRGQSLVLFVLIIPIFILIIMAVIDIGKLTLLKDELNNINYMTLQYGLDNIDDENLDDKLENMIKKNDANVENISVEVSDEKIKISMEKSIDLIMLKNSNIFKVKSSYLGYLRDDKKIIERD